VTALYYIGITLLLLFLWPVLIFSSKARFGVKQKLGLIPDEVRKRLKASIVKPIWFRLSFPQQQAPDSSLQSSVSAITLRLSISLMTLTFR
jgi:hypothetical protein